MSLDSIVDLMEKYKNNYLKSNGKNSFFKKSQKMDCAKEISQSFSLEDMIHKTVFIIPNTNKVVFDYNVYKLYAHPDNFDNIINEVLSVYDTVLLEFSGFEVHILLDTFSISAAERYKDAIRSFCNKCMNANTAYSNLITKIYIYHTPSMIENISTLLRPFIDQSVYSKLIYYTKAESNELIKQLLA
jgi:hypothetical protein